MNIHSRVTQMVAQCPHPTTREAQYAELSKRSHASKARKKNYGFLPIPEQTDPAVLALLPVRCLRLPYRDD